jgi:O-antigen/teichoic acid export membrane protein
MATVKKNLLYSILLTTSGYIMSLVVFPYVSRVLGPANMGIVGFVDGTSGCFAILATMGINFLGIREISRTRNDRTAISTTYSNLIALSIISTLIAVSAFIVCALIVPSLRQYSALVCWGTLSIAAQSFLIEWFYKGLENFKYITVRNVAVKLCYIIAIFLLVRDSSNYVIYFSLIVLTYTINAIINMVYARRFAGFSFHNLKLRTYLKPFLSLGTYTILASLYITFNPMFLGIATNETQVGYYSVSVKLFIIILSSFSALTAVLMPHMSVLLAKDEKDAFMDNSRRTISVFTALAAPLTILGIFYSPQIVLLISGDAYTDAILPMQILMPLLFINGYEQILNVQILMPLNSDNKIFRNSRIVMLLLVALNFALVPHFGAIGSAMVWLTCELVMLILSQHTTRKYIGMPFQWKALLHSIAVCLPCILLLIGISFLPINQYIQAVVGGIAFIVFYFLIQITMLKNDACIFILKQIKTRKHA